MKKTMILLSIVLMIVFVSCESTAPENKIKTPDEMSWTVDTFRTAPTDIQLIPKDMIAFSPKDVWIAFYSGGLTECVQHYNGKEWYGYKRGQVGVIINALEGKSSHDIWAVGYFGNGPSITHYDGMSWTPYSERWTEELIDITKDDEGNYWACGRSGLILKYSKGKWESQRIKINLNSTKKEGFWLKSIVNYKNKIHVLANLSGDGILASYHFVGKDNDWAVVDSFRYPETNLVKFGKLKFVVIDNKLYSCGDLGVYKFNNNTWTQILNAPYQFQDLCGINENYLIAVGYLDKAYFYNGINWQQITKPFRGETMSDALYTCWTNGKETFLGAMLWNERGVAVVFHGK